MTIPKELKSWVENWVATSRLSTDFSITPIAGDGSTRQFFRLVAGNSSFIVLHDPSWTLSQDYPAHQLFLQSQGIPVPGFPKSDSKAGVLVMEDLGDELLQFRITEQPETKFDWLSQATTLLAKLHGETFPVPPSLPVATRRFDQKKYTDEFLFTLEHLSHGLLGLPKATDEERKIIEKFTASLETVSPEVFAHRDYHCRNLLVHKEKLVMIDFQDARLGPPHYDLASLLYDAYVPISEAERTDLKEIYRKALSSYVLSDAIDWDTFDLSFRLVAYQRTIKAAGSFASFYTRNQKKTHLPYLVPALKSALELQKHCAAETLAVRKVLPIEKWIELFSTIKLK